MKKLVRAVIAGLATAGILAGIQIYSGSAVSWIPSLIGFFVSGLAALALSRLRLPGGGAAYRIAVIVSSVLILGVLFGISMGGGEVTATSLVAGISLIALGSVIMWPVTLIGVAVYLAADIVAAKV